MIRYALACENGHEFESWFPSSSSYDAQAERGLVSCPLCGSGQVGKQLMTPSLGRKGRRAAEPERATGGTGLVEAPSPPPASVALMSEREQAVRAMLRAVREHVTQNSDYVGPRFAAEARRMHDGETEHRSIYGEANKAEVKALMEDGIEIQAIPILPDDRN